MKKLLNKTIKPFILFSIIILAISIPVYFLIINGIWQEELDEHHVITRNKIEKELNSFADTIDVNEVVKQFNRISLGSKITVPSGNLNLEDSIYSHNRYDPYYGEVERFRVLSSIIKIHNQPYRFTIETNIEESEETVMAISLVTLSFLVLLIGGIYYINRILSKRVWRPFYKTLNNLKSFDLSDEASVNFENTDILEFEELNVAITKLINQNILVYQQQKEFTENASHELQTPLAILKSKIDLLLQDNTLSEEQMEKIAALNIPLARASRINKNLLLLAKTENQKLLDNSEPIDLCQLIKDSVGFLNESILTKNIHIETEYLNNPTISANRNLLEMLILNLLLNATKHNLSGGKIYIQVSNSSLVIANSGTDSLNTESLFKRFVSSSKTTGGSGLGLAIVKEICQRYNWQVSYEFREKNHIFSIQF